MLVCKKLSSRYVLYIPCWNTISPNHSWLNSEFYWFGHGKTVFGPWRICFIYPSNQSNNLQILQFWDIEVYWNIVNENKIIFAGLKLAKTIEI